MKARQNVPNIRMTRSGQPGKCVGGSAAPTGQAPFAVRLLPTSPPARSSSSKSPPPDLTFSDAVDQPAERFFFLPSTAAAAVMSIRLSRSISGRPPPLRSDLPVSFRLPANDALGSSALTCACAFGASFLSGAPNIEDVATSFKAAAVDLSVVLRAWAELRGSGVVFFLGVTFPLPVGTISTY